MFSIYFLIAGVFFITFYLLGRKLVFHRKIQQFYPKMKHIRREIGYSALTCVIFTAVSTIAFSSGFIRNHSVYHHFGSYFQHWFYIPVFYLVMLLFHDAYFYWTHRMMHHRWLFRWVHRTHHRSSSPSPLAAFAFSPLEAVIQVATVPVFLFIIPLSPVHVNVFFMITITYIIYGHLGFEIYPRQFNRHWLGKWINTAVNHDLHHIEGRHSFGIYFTIWDRMMRTLNSRYDQYYKTVTERR
jgi:Delta7-sterol 5-desaturase